MFHYSCTLSLSLSVVLFSTLVVVVSSQYHHSNINAKHQTRVQCLCLCEFIISSVIHICIVYKLIVCVCINEESYVYLWRFTQTLSLSLICAALRLCFYVLKYLLSFLHNFGRKRLWLWCFRLDPNSDLVPKHLWVEHRSASSSLEILESASCAGTLSSEAKT